MAVRLHLGCASVLMPGWINCDAQYPQADIICNCLNIPIEKGTVDEIYTSHMVEHLFPDEFEKALCHWYELMVDGGILTIRVPDGEYYCDFWKSLPPDRKIEGTRCIFGGTTPIGLNQKWYFHHNLMSQSYLDYTLRVCGFTILQNKKVTIRDVDTYITLRSGIVEDGKIGEGDIYIKGIKYGRGE